MSSYEAKTLVMTVTFYNEGLHVVFMPATDSTIVPCCQNSPPTPLWIGGLSVQLGYMKLTLHCTNHKITVGWIAEIARAVSSAGVCSAFSAKHSQRQIIECVLTKSD